MTKTKYQLFLFSTNYISLKVTLITNLKNKVFYKKNDYGEKNKIKYRVLSI